MLFSETFKIDVHSLPSLQAFDLQVSHTGDSIHSLGGKLAYRFRTQFGGHWVWDRTTWRLISDYNLSSSQISGVLTELWSGEEALFHSLQAVIGDTNWAPKPRSLAQWVAFALLPDYQRVAMAALSSFNKRIGNVLLKREYDLKPWVVDAQPAISVSIKTNAVFMQDLNSVLLKHTDFDPIGLFVADKLSSLRGEVVAVSGLLGEHRERLLRLAKREASQAAISSAPDDELVLAVKPSFGRQAYDYIAGVLDISLRTQDFDRFGIDGKQVLNEMRLSPATRSQMVRIVIDELNRSGLKLRSYRETDGNFHIDKGYADRGLLFGNMQRIPYNPRSLYHAMKNNGLYRVHPRFSSDPTLRIGFIDYVNDRQAIHHFMRQLLVNVGPLGFEPKTVNIVSPQPTRDDVERAVSELSLGGADIIVGFLPDEREGEDEHGLYNLIKSVAVRDGVPSQMVLHSTLTDEFAVGNIVLGIVAKTGNIPFILGAPLEYADILIGIDIARMKRRNLSGTVNIVATARIYQNNGEFLAYSIVDAPVEGETLFPETLEALLPVRDFANKRVVVHRDGPFRGDEKRVLEDWGSRIGAEFYPIEILKSGAPRIYATEGKEVVQPVKGSSFYLSAQQAIVVSSLPPFRDATPQPLHVRSDVLPIREAVDSVLSLTLLHHGSLAAPRLPVTLHYSDKIAGMLLDGIRPRALDGNVPYWL